MILWTILIFSVLLLAASYDNTKNTQQKKVLFFLLFFILMYFSGFRDGLGVDYESYKLYNSAYNYPKNILILSESFYLHLSRFIYNSSFSYVLFFVLMSSITVYSSLMAYKRYDNLFALVFVFLLFPSIYMTSFTLVRSAAAGSIFLYSLIYLENRSIKSILIFLLLIIVAITIHKSSIIFLVCIFFNKNDYKTFSLFLVALLITALTFTQLFLTKLIQYLEIFSYESYYEYDLMRLDFFSASNILLHLFLFPLFYYRKQILNLKESGLYIIPIKCFILALFFADISAFLLPFSYRFFYNFIIFFPIVFLVIVTVTKNPILKGTLYFIIILFGLKSLIYGINDPLIISDSILPPYSLFDFGVQYLR